jgi:hypothetical protein
VSYDPFSEAKMQIDDGLGLRVKPINAPAMPQSPVQGHISPNIYQMPAGAPNPGQQFGAPPTGAPGQQQPMAGRFGGVGGGVSTPVGPGTLNINGGTNLLFKLAQLAAQYNVGPINAGVNYQPGAGVGGGMTYARGPVEIGGGYDPRRGGYGNVALRQPFQEGGLATSIPGSYETHASDMDFIRDRYDQMHEVAGKYHAALGGFAVK